MCGILGLWQVNGKSTQGCQWEQLVEAMRNLRHRGPDDYGYVHGEPPGVLCSTAPDDIQRDKGIRFFLGHTRLSILDLSIAGHQPMTSHDGRAIMVYNGEIYNYIELRDELKSLGHRFYSNTDSEVLLAAYCQWGEDSLPRLNGMWALAIFDIQRQTLFLSRDRFGIKPLHYIWDGSRLVFASEIGPLLIASGHPREANETVIYNYLTHSLIPWRDETFFKGVHKVLPGESLILREQGYLERRRWWNLTPAIISHRHVEDRWRELFLDSVRLRLRADVSVGACLSGGLDSTAVVGAMANLLRNNNRKLHTFTCCYEPPHFNERPYAEEVARMHDTHAEWIYPMRESKLEEHIERLVLIQEEPFVSLSVYSQYLVMQRVKEAGVKVLLDGQGGDELFWGYDHGHVLYLISLLRKGKIRQAFETWWSVCKKNSELRGLHFLKFLGYYGIPTVRWKRNVELAKVFLEPSFLKEKNEDWLFEVSTALRSSDIPRIYIERSPLPSLLRYEDRNSMAFSVEARLPFLDYRLVRFALALTPSQQLNGGWSKAVERAGMQGWSPNIVRWRKDKRGFPTPTQELVNLFVSDYQEIFGSNSKSNRFLRANYLRNGSKSDPRVIRRMWHVLNLELWMRLYDIT